MDSIIILRTWFAISRIIWCYIHIFTYTNTIVKNPMIMNRVIINLNVVIDVDKLSANERDFGSKVLVRSVLISINVEIITSYNSRKRQIASDLANHRVSHKLNKVLCFALLSFAFSLSMRNRFEESLKKLIICFTVPIALVTYKLSQTSTTHKFKTWALQCE